MVKFVKSSLPHFSMVSPVSKRRLSAVCACLLLGEAGIHHVDDAIDGDGGLCNVGGHHHLPAMSQIPIGWLMKKEGFEETPLTTGK